jgi:ABC-type bacteriocin/lantibiotic exporter with double-glycine peptidase domain
VIGEVGGRFQYDRTTLLKRLELSTEDVLSRYNEDAEADQVAKMLQGTVVRFVLTVFAGFGLGAVGVVLLAGTSLDIASVGVGVLIVLLGFLVIPRRRRRLKARVADQMETLREQLEAQLEEQVNEELQRASERLTGAVAPYTRFVKSELGRLHTLDAELSRIDAQLGTLRADVDDLRA